MERIDRAALNAIYAEYAKDKAFKQLKHNGNGRTLLVEGEGANPRVFIAGEAPGATEAIYGRPYAGRAGLVLRRLMEQANLFTIDSILDGTMVRGNCWLTNTIKYRPPGRQPWMDEIQASRPYLVREWMAVGEPSVIVCVGVAAYIAVLGTHPTGRRMGVPQEGENGRVIWPMFSPTYGMRSEGIRPAMEVHWRALGKWLDDRNS